MSDATTNDVKDILTPDDTPDPAPTTETVAGTSPANDPGHTGYAVYDTALQRFVSGVHDEETANSIATRITSETSDELGITKRKLGDRFEVRAV